METQPIQKPFHRPYIRHSPHAGLYLNYWKEVINAARTGAPVMFRLEWSRDPMDAQNARREFMQALHNRINARAGLDVPRGKKDTTYYLYMMFRDRNRLRDIHNRIRVYQFETDECRRRFSHLLSHHDD